MFLVQLLICVAVLYLASSIAISRYHGESLPHKRSFNAAVVEFKPEPFGIGLTPEEYYERNLDKIEVIIDKAATQDVDVLVFPEYGITPTMVLALPLDQAGLWMQEVPRDDTEQTTNRNFVIRKLQSLSRIHKMYIVANLATRENCSEESDPLCPHYGYHYYNTNLAFGRNGTILAKYRKYNRYGEEHLFSPTPNGPDVATFVADFGVKFGMMICFDIHFQSPWQELQEREVEVMLYSTSWIDELPFLTAVQYHPGWAWAHDILTLASGRHDPISGAMGSGFYGGSQGILKYSYDSELTDSVLLVAHNIAVDEKQSGTTTRILDLSLETSGIDKSYHYFLEQDLSIFSWIELTSESDLLRLNLNRSQCELHYEFTDGPINGSFAFIGYRGVRTFGGGRYFSGIDNCGIVFCSTRSLTDLSTCGKRVDEDSSHGLVFTRLSLIHKHPPGTVSMPVTLTMPMQPMNSTNLTYQSNLNETSLITKSPLSELYSFGLFARAFELDIKKMRA